MLLFLPLLPDSSNSSLTSSTTVLAELAQLPTKSTANVAERTKSTTASFAQATMSTSSNSPELTTEKLSLPIKSAAESQSQVRLDTAAAVNITNPKSSNVKQQQPHRIINSNVYHPVSGGGVRAKGQKIEMPQLNDFFDHNEYLKKHERGFRWVLIEFRIANSTHSISCNREIHVKFIRPPLPAAQNVANFTSRMTWTTHGEI